MDEPSANGLPLLEEALPSTWDAAADPGSLERLQRLEARGVLSAAGFLLHEPDLAA